MSFRPRYSLLTLLVVTVLIAGGVKLWRGPHHVVERPTANLEDEYTYTRDWRGNKIVHGPRIKRSIRKDGSIHQIQIQYYLHGQATEHKQTIHALSQIEKLHAYNYRPKPPALPDFEQELFEQVTTQEADKIRASGFRPGFEHFIDFDLPEYEQTANGTWVVKVK